MSDVAVRTAEIEPAPMGLGYWADAVGGKARADDEAFARMVSHPRFREACETTMRNALVLTQRYPKMARVMIDIHRALLGFFVLYLDARGLVTHATVRDFCVEVGLTSPGRATAILINMRMIGYIVPDPVQPDRRSRRYILSQETRAFFHEAFRLQMIALSLIEPQALAIADRFEDPAIYKGFVLAVCNGLANASRRGDTSEISLFDRRNAGLGILFRLCVSGRPDDTLPPSRPIPLSINALASEFGVSRPHVRKLLRDAEAAGLVRRHTEESTLVLEKVLQDAVIRHHATILMGFAYAACAALHAAGETA
jgi:DNA-binding MarR family transcriptional regulator